MSKNEDKERNGVPLSKPELLSRILTQITESGIDAASRTGRIGVIMFDTADWKSLVMHLDENELEIFKSMSVILDRAVLHINNKQIPSLMIEEYAEQFFPGFQVGKENSIPLFFIALGSIRENTDTINSSLGLVSQRYIEKFNRIATFREVEVGGTKLTEVDSSLVELSQAILDGSFRLEL
jgi:hypothetical protein